VTPAKRPRTVRLAASAEAEIGEILRWTARHFGEGQARIYAGTLGAVLEELGEGAEALGAHPRDDIAKGLFTLHVARHGRKGRHFVIFRIGREGETETVDVLRVLHDAMDLPRHLPPDEVE
jgi:toxin ParE1/3/4